MECRAQAVSGNPERDIQAASSRNQKRPMTIASAHRASHTAGRWRINCARPVPTMSTSASSRPAEEAESPLGRLWLNGLLTLKAGDVQAARDRYDAGNMFAQVVGAYLSVIEAPGGTSGSGRKSSCQADLLCALDTSECACFGARRRYTNSY